MTLKKNFMSPDKVFSNSECTKNFNFMSWKVSLTNKFMMAILKKQVEEETEKIGLKKEDALRRDKWRDGVRAFAEEIG